MVDDFPASVRRSLDPEEVRRFGALAERWWDPDGPMAPLHRMNPLRARHVVERACRHFGRAPDDEAPLRGLSLLDVGCGGGLFAEAAARAGARVVGIDPAAENAAAAARHAEVMGYAVDYRAAGVEDVAASGESFDVVTALEVVEHVADVPDFLASCAAVVRPGGLFVLSTLNRTPRSFLFGIVGAEYLLRWLPRGTHDWRRFRKPSEIARDLRAAGLRVVHQTGVEIDPGTGDFRPTRDLAVNYTVTATREA